MEATPQVYINIILMVAYGGASGDPLVWITFMTSIISASFGIAKLLKNGPIKMVRTDGLLGGFLQSGFVLLIITVAGNMIGKGLWFAILSTTIFNLPFNSNRWAGFGAATASGILALLYLQPLLLVKSIFLVNIN